MDPSPETGADRGRPAPASSGRVAIDVLSAIALPVLIAGGIFLAPFLRDPTQMPFGADTVGYVWRSSVVQADGVSALEDVVRSLGARPLQPVVAAIFLGSTEQAALVWAIVSPAVLAAIIALAAGAVATDGLGEHRRRSLVYGVGVGSSAFVAWTAYAYAANLTLDPMALGLVLVASLVAFGSARRLAGVLLLLGAALAHYLFAVVIVGLLLLFGVLLLAAERRFRGPDRPPDGAARRVLTMLGAGVAAAVGGIALSPQLPTRVPTISVEGPFTQLKTSSRLPQMALWATVPLAALGGWLRIRTGTSMTRWMTALLLVWASMAPISVLAWYVLEVPLPPYRWAAFALPVPLLVVAAALALGEPLRRSGVAIGKIAAGALAAVVAGALAAAGAAVWWNAGSEIDRAMFAELGTVANYARTIPAETPVVLVTRRNQPTETPDRILAALPADVIERFSVLPTAVDRTRDDLGIQAPEGAAILWISTLGQPEPLPGVGLGPGVVLVAGPPPGEPVVPGELPRAPPAGRLVLLASFALIGLGVAGSGWAGLAGVPAIGRIALAPTFGLALLGSLGTLGSRLGIPFTRLGSLGLVLVTAAAGWVVDLGLRRSRGGERAVPPRRITGSPV